MLPADCVNCPGWALLSLFRLRGFAFAFGRRAIISVRQFEVAAYRARKIIHAKRDVVIISEIKPGQLAMQMFSAPC
jgi:hypothetical protein